MTDNTTTLKVLFVCEANRLRSPTAETIFSGYPGVEAKSAGLAKQATVPVSAELLDWADLIFVMEKRHRNIIHSRFKEIYLRKRIICLYIPDEFEFMDPELISVLEEKVTPYLDRSSEQNMVDR
ncbi:MAG TPA: phosphotyrosine protein phosphatase [Blastocatellia bacterium]|nr:phosphotyrosine protein phosphatase [Blastocatellia bacterium]